MKLLVYLDRLNLYEQVLGGKSHAADRFQAEKFQKIRSQPILDMAIDYARVSLIVAANVHICVLSDDDSIRRRAM
jgi:hypothetical protein